MRHSSNLPEYNWSLSNKLAAASLFIAVLATIVGVISPELRCSIGLASEGCFAPNYIDVKSSYNQGKKLLELERYDEALRYFERVIEIDPKNINAWRERGVTLRFLKRQQEALASFEKALLLNPNDELSREYRNILLHEPKNQIRRPENDKK
jgi:tetratricopeptide (TPR) repeat protein